MNNSTTPFRPGDPIRVLASGELATVKALTAHSIIAYINGLDDNLILDPAQVESALDDLLCSVCNAVIGTIPAPAPPVPIRCQQCRRDPGCASWCPTGDGHPGELFEADKICYGAETVVALTIEPSPGVGMVASAEVSPVRRPGGKDSVYIAVNQRHGVTDFDATVSEARQLAAVLLQVADAVDAD
ncbi:DUF6907 domain-containing protein [Nocardia sp. Marseille-Q1738]